jgi:site-specific DNA recombinase
MDYSQFSFALYARKSTEDEGKQVQSIEDQIRYMKEKADSYGIRLKRNAIIKEEKSAKTPGNRPKFSQLVVDIKAGKYNALLCWQTNRLSRNPQESGTIQQLLQDGYIKCIVTSDRIYLPDDNAVVFAVEMGISNQFVRDLMKNVRRGMVSKAERGWLPCRPPIGYRNDRENRTIICDPERYSLVRQMWDMMLTGGYTVSEIARIAEIDWGLATIPRRKQGGKPLAAANVYALFHNPFYTGYLRYAGSFYKGKHTAMVTQTEFDRVQELLSRKNAPRPTIDEERKPDPFPYRGLVRCGDCGCLITYTRKIKTYKNGTAQVFEYCYCTRKRKDFNCPNTRKIKPHELTQHIRDELAKYTIIDDFFQWAVRFLDEFDAAESAKQQEIYRQQVKAIETTENQLRELNRMRYRGQVDDAFYESEKRELESKLVLLRGQFDDQERANREHRKKLEEYFNFARYAQEDFEGDNDLKKKKVLAIVGQNLLFKDGYLWFEPIPYLTPLMPKYQELKRRYDEVMTQPEQGRASLVAQIISDWYTWQDSNLRPLAPQANALSS